MKIDNIKKALMPNKLSKNIENVKKTVKPEFNMDKFVEKVARKQMEADQKEEK